MVLIPAGEFPMGDTFNEGDARELPVHAVHVDAFYMDVYMVTNREYADALNWALSRGNLISISEDIHTRAVYQYQRWSGGYCGWDPPGADLCNGIKWDGHAFSAASGRENYPTVMVSWYGAAAYANWRSAMQGKPLSYDWSTWACNFGSGYRLPTEAEWEKAARGGVAGHRFPWSDTDTIQHARANYFSDASYTYDTSPTRGYHPTFSPGTWPWSSPVGYFAPNGYGLYDMAGNMQEWCNDWYSQAYYSTSPYDNPQGPASGTDRVLRGGWWCGEGHYCRCASRNFATPDFWYDCVPGIGGFRLVLDAE